MEYGSTINTASKANTEKGVNGERVLSSATDDTSAGKDEPGPWAFHLVLCFAGLYMSMVLTNWGASDGDNEKDTVGVGWESLWVKIISQWLTILLYVWTLIAPIIFPDRDFTPGGMGSAF